MNINSNLWLQKILRPNTASLCVMIIASLLSLQAFSGDEGIDEGIKATRSQGIPNSADDIRPILVGQELPNVALRDISGNKKSLDSIVKKAPTLFVFYRGSWCPYCNRHLSELRKLKEPFAKLGIQIVGISPDTPKFLKESVANNKLEYGLYSDSTMDVAKALGLAFKVPNETLKMLSKYDIDLVEQSGQKHQMLPVPAAILVDAEGLVHYTFVAPNYKIRASNKVILAAAEVMLDRPEKK